MAESRLKLDRLAPKQRERIRLLHGSLMYRDRRLNGFDAASVVEVVEHLDPPGCVHSSVCCSSRRGLERLL